MSQQLLTANDRDVYQTASNEVQLVPVSPLTWLGWMEYPCLSA